MLSVQTIPALKKREKSPAQADRVQAKLAINQPGDAYEQEADAIAEQVMRMPLNRQPAKSVSTTGGLIGASVQRKCAHCEEEEKKQKVLMRKESNGSMGTQASPSLSAALAASKGAGHPMPNATRGFMENAFSTDFSGVRLHTDHRAAKMNENIHAKAFTHESDIYFNQGQYAPNSSQGKQLLAHELTHILQQGAGKPAIQRDAVYEEVPGTPVRSTTGGDTVYTGSVERNEYRNEADRQAHARRIYSSSVNIRYNETSCQMVVPLSIRFINQDAAHTTTCGDITAAHQDPVTPASSAAFNDVKRRFFNDVPNALNGWYSVVLEGDSCSACREVAVRVEFTEVTSGAADKTVIVTGNSGRSYVTGDDTTVALCSGYSQETNTLIHEAGHFALGIGDEYHETEASRPQEREHPGEYSRMAQDAPGGLLEFQDRHFAFATAFLQSVYPACRPRLRRLRTGPLEITIPVGYSYYSTDTGGDSAITAGVQFGIPLTAMRRVSLLIGPNFSYLFGNQEFLAGLRVGIEGRAPLGFVGSLGFRAFGEAGGSYGFGSGAHSGLGGYAEGGAGIDLRLNNAFLIRAEAAAGRLDIARPGESDYWRFGAAIGGSF